MLPKDLASSGKLGPEIIRLTWDRPVHSSRNHSGSPARISFFFQDKSCQLWLISWLWLNATHQVEAKSLTSIFPRLHGAPPSGVWGKSLNLVHHSNRCAFISLSEWLAFSVPGCAGHEDHLSNKTDMACAFMGPRVLQGRWKTYK